MAKAKRKAETAPDDGDVGHQQLLQQLKRIDAEGVGDSDAGADEPGTLRERFTAACHALHVKAVLAHIGLMVSLSIYCVVGGLVGVIHCKSQRNGRILCGVLKS